MKKLFFIVGILLLSLVAFAYMGQATAPTGRGAAKLDEIRVKRENLIESTVATGTVKPKVGAEVKVGSQISGLLVKLNVGIGDSVKKGELLAVLDDSSLRAKVNTLRAELQSAIAEEKYATLKLEKYEHAASIISPLQIEDLRRNVSVRRAGVAQAQGKLTDAEVQLGYTRILAPISGTVASVSTYVGETVAASFSAPTFVTIVDLRQLEIQAYVDETDIGKVHEGQQVQFQIDSFPGKQLTGTVRAIYPKAQLINNVVNYVLLIDIQNTGALPIRPEMTARVDLILARKDSALTVPRSALFKEHGNTYLVVKTGSAWAPMAVKTGLKTSQFVEVISGVSEGETIIGDAQQWKESKKEAKQ